MDIKNFLKRYRIAIISGIAVIIAGLLGFIIWNQNTTIKQQSAQTQKMQQEQKAMEELVEMNKLDLDRKSTRLNSSHNVASRMPSSA